MVIHKRIFCDFWDIYPGERLMCWVPGCQREAVDPMHITGKGMGGRASVEFIENYCPGCREHHLSLPNNEDTRTMLYDEVCRRIMQEKPNHVWTDRFMDTPYFKNNFL